MAYIPEEPEYRFITLPGPLTNFTDPTIQNLQVNANFTFAETFKQIVEHLEWRLEAFLEGIKREIIEDRLVSVQTVNRENEIEIREMPTSEIFHSYVHKVKSNATFLIPKNKTTARNITRNRTRRINEPRYCSTAEHDLRFEVSEYQDARCARSKSNGSPLQFLDDYKDEIQAVFEQITANEPTVERYLDLRGLDN